MFDILVKAIKAIKSGLVEVVIFLLLVLALTGLFATLGAGQTGGLLSIVGAGMLVYSIHQHKKRKAGAGLQGGTDVKGGD